MKLFGREKTKSGHYEVQSMWQCECHANHYIAIEYYEEPDGSVDETSFSIIDESRASDWWARVTAAARILRGRSHVWSEVLLDSKAALEMAADLQVVAGNMTSPSRQMVG